MKLMIIVLCLLSERYLVHALSFKRFDWYASYWGKLQGMMPKHGLFENAYVMVSVAIFPFVLAAGLVLALFGNALFGFVLFAVHLTIFYYCLGPVNPFYPVSTAEKEGEALVNAYFAEVNRQLFAVIFWYILLGPIAVLMYRLLDVSAQQKGFKKALSPVMDVLDWVPARITLLLYLLAGNFQFGLNYFIKQAIASPRKNTELLSKGGVFAAKSAQSDAVTLPMAQTLVEHGLVIYLVFLAFFTLASWM